MYGLQIRNLAFYRKKVVGWRSAMCAMHDAKDFPQLARPHSVMRDLCAAYLNFQSTAQVQIHSLIYYIFIESSDLSIFPRWELGWSHRGKSFGSTRRCLVSVSDALAVNRIGLNTPRATIAVAKL